MITFILKAAVLIFITVAFIFPNTLHNYTIQSIMALLVISQLS